jgi:hypothetical protein
MVSGMAIRNNLLFSKRFRAMAQRLLWRTIAITLGAFGIIWGVLLLPRFLQAASLNHMATEFVQGHVFTQKAMAQVALQVEPELSLPLCNPAELHNAVVLHLAMLNDSLAKKDQSLVEQSYAPLYGLGRNALACAPSDGFTWLTLFWIDAEKRGVGRENLAYLRLSYEVSPNEGWIAIWRNRLAMTMFDRLPSELANKALDEFVRLLDSSQLYDEMASIFESIPADVQQRVVQQLRGASPLSRQIFARVLYDRGLDIKIPETAIPGLRSWEH